MYAHIRSFSEIGSYEFFQEYKKSIQDFLRKKGKEYVLGVDEQEFLEYLYDRYLLQPLELIENSLQVLSPTKENRMVEHWALSYRTEVDVFNFPIQYEYIGSSILFSVHPQTYTLTSYDIELDEYKRLIKFNIIVERKDKQEFDRAMSSAYRDAFANLENVNKDVLNFNNELKVFIPESLRDIKREFEEEDSFFKSINVVTTAHNFEVPIIKKLFQPKYVEVDTEKSPFIKDDIYIDILHKIRNCGKSIEKKPSTYIGKDEEALRDIFLLYLEDRYENASITGETFNKQGKTDILLKHTDGSNLFIAECKFWHGEKEFSEAINQLFDRYLTWRDSKTALLMFVDNKKITGIEDTIKNKAKDHKYFESFKGKSGESSLSFKFHLPDDSDALVDLEIIYFHYPKA